MKNIEQLFGILKTKKHTKKIKNMLRESWKD